MATAATMKFTGARALDKKIAVLSVRVANKVAKASLRVGAKIVLAEAKKLAPVDEEGRIPPSLKIKAAKRSRGKNTRGYTGITVSTRDGWFQGATFYAAFVEFGHFMGSRKGAKASGAQRTWIPPTPFVRPAWDSKKFLALAAIKKALLVKTEQEAIRS